MGKRDRRKRRKAGRVAERSSPPPPQSDLFSENWRAITAIAIVLILAVVAIWAVTQADWGDGGEPNGNGPDKEVAPAFALQDIDGELFSLDVFKGRVVILDLFATWCGPCRLQMEELNRLRAHYPDGVVVILSVDVDPGETSQMIRDFRDEYSATWKFARDTDDLSTKYDASSIPTMVIIDRDGYIAWRHQGVTSFEDLQQLIEPLLQSG
jgi:thiol-disulfide isomerase/thioredoxin